MHKNFKDITGRRFGRLEALYVTRKGNNGRFYWMCQCDCGNLKEVCSRELNRGDTQSCGCIHKEFMNGLQKKNTIHGKGRKIKHDSLYTVWINIKQRCFNPKQKAYKNYGGRGIGMFEAWVNDFVAFETFAISSGWVEGLTIERMNVNKDYIPDNICWIPLINQVRNRTNSLYVEVSGEKVFLADLARQHELPYSKLYYYIFKKKMEPLQAIQRLKGG